ncbi:MAG TPA: DUF805 domain-containing protein [Telluria sp.]
MNDSCATYMPAMLSWRGRLGRLRFLVYTVLPMYAACVLLLVVDYVVRTACAGTWHLTAPLACMWVALAGVTALRRLDDLNHARWWGLLLLVPCVNVFFWCYLLCARSSAAAHERGPAPAPNTMLVKLGAGMAAWLLLGTVWAVSVIYMWFPQ